MKSQSVVTDLRRKIFAEVARVAYKSESVAGDIEAIPYIITPDEEPKYRENIYRERQIACALRWAFRSAPQTNPCTSPRAWTRAI